MPFGRVGSDLAGRLHAVGGYDDGLPQDPRRRQRRLGPRRSARNREHLHARERPGREHVGDDDVSMRRCSSRRHAAARPHRRRNCDDEHGRERVAFPGHALPGLGAGLARHRLLGERGHLHRARRRRRRRRRDARLLRGDARASPPHAARVRRARLRRQWRSAPGTFPPSRHLRHGHHHRGRAAGPCPL